MVRQDVVDALVEIALEAMRQESEQATADEVLSACMTIAYKAILVVRDQGGNMEAFREGIARMYAELPEVTAH